ncbi:extensin [Burkholderia sp. Bp8963]|uniref:extensin n=1 Tax=Burkholderia sp. Bp8963 TaxID=2184547 RepID=UPI000F5ACC3F|nr:extensin [Burkholderia sp. Bp8963]
MRNTRKTLMIAGGLVVVAISASYLMLLKADHRAVAEATAGIGDSAQTPPDADLRSGDNHVSQGSIGQAALPAATSKPADAAPQPAPATAPPAPAPATVANAPAPAAVTAPPPPPPPAPVTVTVDPAPPPGPAAPSVSAPPQPKTQPSAPPSAAVASVDAQKSPASTTNRTQRAPRGRDGLERHATAATANRGSATTPETAALVRESSKLDPSLPPPKDLPVPSSTDQRSSSAGANPVAAAMTERLVKESSSVGTSSPQPSQDNSGAAK